MLLYANGPSQVYAGDRADPNALVDAASGKSLPRPLTLNTPLLVRFTTDESVTGSGFEARCDPRPFYTDMDHHIPMCAPLYRGRLSCTNVGCIDAAHLVPMWAIMFDVNEQMRYKQMQDLMPSHRAC